MATAAAGGGVLLDPIEVEDTVLLIRQSATVQLERVQSYVDGALLAVEQVQDKRFEILQQSLDATASQNFVSFVVTLCLESTVAGSALAAITRKIVRPMLRSSAAFNALPVGRDRAAVAEFLRAVRGRGPGQFSLAQARELRSDMGIGVNRLRRFAALLGRGSSGTTTNLVSVAKAAWVVADRERTDVNAPPLVLDDTDTAGVGILAGAQEYASNHRIAITLVHATLENFVRTAQMTATDRDVLVEQVHWESLDEDLKFIRDRYKLLFEAVIWAKLYGFDTIQPPSISGNAKSLRGVEDEVLEYWRQRLAKPIEEWSRGNPRGAPLLGQATGIDPIPQAGLRKEPLTKQVSYVYQYLRTLGTGIPEDPTAFRSRR